MVRSGALSQAAKFIAIDREISLRNPFASSFPRPSLASGAPKLSTETICPSPTLLSSSVAWTAASLFAPSETAPIACCTETTELRRPATISHASLILQTEKSWPSLTSARKRSPSTTRIRAHLPSGIPICFGLLSELQPFCWLWPPCVPCAHRCLRSKRSFLLEISVLSFPSAHTPHRTAACHQHVTP